MRFLFSAFLLLFFCTAPSFADAPVRVPYASLYHALEPGLAIGKFDRLIARQRIQSRRLDVAPQHIAVQIMAKSGVIAVPISPLGEIQFPMTQALLDENPWVQSNQPKGSLSLSATMEIKLSGQKNYAYQDIYASAMQAQQVLAKLGPGMAGRRIRSIEFEFNPSDGARAELIDARGEELLISNAAGMLELRVDESLVKRQVQVKFSHLPRAARPHIN
jgi:hypothetical protein